MSTEESDDPGADTAMFRAFVEDGYEPTAARATSRWVRPAVIVAVVVVVLVAVLLIA